MIRAAGIVTCAVAAWAIAAAGARAQAWVSPAGTGTVGVSFQSIDNIGHASTSSLLNGSGKSRNHAVYVEADYAVTDRISLAAGIPFVFAKFIGPWPDDVVIRPVDGCYCWNSGWQDLAFVARANVLNGAFALTPSLFVGQPSHDYDYQGEAAIGRRLRELGVALDAGARLDAISPRLAVQGRYAYSWVEQVLDIPNDRSRISGELMLLVTDALSMRTSIHRQITHGGLRAGTGGPTAPNGYPWGEIQTQEQYDEHDRVMRDNNWRFGLGVTYSWSRIDVYASLLEFVGGTDTHAGRAVTTGVVMRFER